MGCAAVQVVLATEAKVDAVMDKVWILPAVGGVLSVGYVVVGLVVVVVLLVRNESLWRQRCQWAMAMGRPPAAGPVQDRRYLVSSGRRSPRRVELRHVDQPTAVLRRVSSREETVELKSGGWTR